MEMTPIRGRMDAFETIPSPDREGKRHGIETRNDRAGGRPWQGTIRSGYAYPRDRVGRDGSGRSYRISDVPAIAWIAPEIGGLPSLKSLRPTFSPEPVSSFPSAEPVDLGFVSGLVMPPPFPRVFATPTVPGGLGSFRVRFCRLVHSPIADLADSSGVGFISGAELFRLPSCTGVPKDHRRSMACSSQKIESIGDSYRRQRARRDRFARF